MTNTDLTHEMLEFVRHIASFQTCAEVYPDATEKDQVWLENDSEDLEALIRDARKILAALGE